MNALTMLVACARNNAWANDRLYNACAQLSIEDLRSQRTSFFPTILKTLNHILIVDWYYIDAFLGEGRGRSVFEKEEDTFTEFAPLRAAQIASDEKLLRFVSAIENETALDGYVNLERDDHVQIEPVGNVLLHVFQHQTHHRGQVHAMLSGTDVPPPQLDEFFIE